MALTNSRPLQIPTMEHEMLHNSTSPVFQLGSINLSGNNAANARAIAAGLNSNALASFPGSETVDLVDVNPAMNPNMNINTATPAKKSNSNVTDADGDASDSDNKSASGSKSPGSNKAKKDSASKKENPLLEVSKLIPVTGERPVPDDRTPPLNDDVLFAVFVLLWESDPSQQGLTVKQLCDLLLVKHPEMSNLSTKLSNLISAKLNAYVKKIEKGEKTMKYAISREWSNSSPRRMLYIYRGILAADYKEHAVKVTNQLKQQMALDNENGENTSGHPSFSDASLQGTPQGSINLASMMNRGSISMVTSMPFSLSPGFNIPYASSPVSVTLNNNTPSKVDVAETSKPNATKDKSTEKGSKATTDGNTNPKKRSSEASKSEGRSKSNNSASAATSASNKPFTTPQNKKQRINAPESSSNTSRSATITPALLSGSHTIASASNGASASSTKQSTYVTAVAAAPRISKLQNKSGMRTNIPNHILHNTGNTHVAMFHPTPVSPRSETAKSEDYDSSEDNTWLKIVRDGFLIQDIASPESITLEELDNIL